MRICLGLSNVRVTLCRARATLRPENQYSGKNRYYKEIDVQDRFQPAQSYHPNERLWKIDWMLEHFHRCQVCGRHEAGFDILDDQNHR